MKPYYRSSVMAAVLLVSAATRAKAMTNAFIPAIQATILSRYSSCCFRCALYPSSDDGFHPHQRHHSIIKNRRRLFSALPLFDSAQLGNEQKILQRSKKNSFVEEVISFLDTNGMSMRPLSLHEIRNALEQYMDQYHSNIDGPKSLDRVDGLMAFLEASVILAIGKGTGKNIPLGTNSSTPAVNATSHDNVDFENHLIDNTSVNSGNGMRQDINHQPHSFILHICPTLTLDTIHKLHQKQRTSSVSEAVAAYAWRNSLLTDAFYYYNSVNGGIEQSSIVHLHQDVWNRSPAIVQSRLRSKCGYYHRRIYARQTVVRRITKSDYIPFLEENHLWGATGAKYGYGVFLKSKMKGAKQHQHQTDAEDDAVLVAVATFSSKREVNRAGSKFHSYELLRFCTKLDTTVVGGLTKLVSAFVKEVKNKQTGKVDDSGSVQPGIDIVTAIDRDFGSNTWPNFERVQVMDPIPMFVGGVDGVRRHAVGVGLAPLEQVGDDSGSLSTSMILRAGLPTSLLQQLDDDDQTHKHGIHDWLWQIVAQHGFHPVFDAGVERLMFIAEAYKTNEMSPSDLWDASLPNYVKEHYSVNSGVQRMLNSIRSTR